MMLSTFAYNNELYTGWCKKNPDHLMIVCEIYITTHEAISSACSIY